MNRRKYSVHDVPNLNLQSMIEDVPNLMSADIYISQPDNLNYSDEDLRNINNLTSRQLEAEAEFQINTDLGCDAASATNTDNETLDTIMDEGDTAEMNIAPDYRILDVTQNVTLSDLTEPSTSSQKRQ